MGTGVEAQHIVFAILQVKVLSKKKKKIMISEVKILLGKASDDFTSKVPPWKGNLRLLKSGQDLVTSTLNTFPLEHIFGKLAC